MAISFMDIELAVDFGSSSFSDSEAYLNVSSGEIVYVSDLVDEEPPSDLYDNEDYILLPTKQDLDLGKPLVLNFADQHLTAHINEIHNIFSRKGAYQRFKHFLASLDKLDVWYEFENEQTKLAIKQWCKENQVAFENET